MFEFKRLRREDLAMVLKWRTSQSVSRYMISDMVPDLDAQVRWYNSTSNIPYWIIKSDDVPIGVINLSDTHKMHKKTSFGYYIAEEEYRKLGGMILTYFYNFVFDTLGFNKIAAEVFCDNSDVIKIHEAHGYRKVGIKADDVWKYDRYHDIMILELFKKTWIKKPFRNLTATFE